MRIDEEQGRVGAEESKVVNEMCDLVLGMNWFIVEWL